MPIKLNEKRPYQRLLHTEDEEKQLNSKGLEAVMSSNVSAAMRESNDLIIRFHGGATYSYAGKGNLFERLMGAASKGKWVWRFLIRPNAAYQKVGSIDIKNDVPSRDMMEQPKKPKYKVSTIIPFDELGNQLLPQITITPLDFLSTMVGTNGQSNLGTIASLFLAGNI